MDSSTSDCCKSDFRCETSSPGRRGEAVPEVPDVRGSHVDSARTDESASCQRIVCSLIGDANRPLTDLVFSHARHGGIDDGFGFLSSLVTPNGEVLPGIRVAEHLEDQFEISRSQG